LSPFGLEPVRAKPQGRSLSGSEGSTVAGDYRPFLESCEADWVATRRSYYQSLAERLPSV